MRWIFISCLLLISTLNAQIYMIGVAPLKAGNYWKYIDVGGMFNDVLCFQVVDSTRILMGYNFNIVQSFESPNFIRYSSYKVLTTDSIYVSYATYVPDSIYTYYKANCKIGDSWIQPVNEFATYTYTVIDTFHITAWGNSYFSKLIKITDFNVTEVYQVWADHLGLMEEQGVGQYHMVLRGCVIDSVLYGDTTTITDVEEEPLDMSVAEYKLSQNYPNPFNPSTIINYSVKDAGLVKIKVFDILGSEVATLVNENKSAGTYTVEFNAANLPSGVYIYTLQVNGFTSSKKMLLMK